MANCKKLMEMTGNIPLGLYETPVPKVRYGFVDSYRC